ncbi:MAG: YebC/PmpR family DNA-binding transcriptional regulator, partial [Desulfuromonadales bacterium]|nr:YebC/PmpR family DNA-binding transcriptional regulator [Desulfuromonadales bacterium]
LISLPNSYDFDQIFEIALEAGADDVKDEGDSIEVITAPSGFTAVRDAIAAQGLKWESAEVTMIPQTMVKLEGKQAEQMLKLMEKLEDYDDVQNVYANFDISDEEMEAILG